MENLVILATHVLFLVGAMLFCRFRPDLSKKTLLLIPGVICVPIFFFVTLVMLDMSQHAGNGTHGAWYLIFSVVTLGAVPVITHFSAAITGICIFRLFFYKRMCRHENGTFGS